MNGERSSRREENEAAFVDSFFLPGGILDPEEEEEDTPAEEPTNEAPALWSGAPPENPWANETRPAAWPSERIPQHEIGVTPPVVGGAVLAGSPERVVSPQERNNGGLGAAPGPIGNASFEPTRPSRGGPLHGSALMRETLQASLVGASSVPPPAKQQHSYNAPVQSSIPPPVLAEPPGFDRKNGGQTLPFRPPPGFTQQPPIRIQEEGPKQPILNEEEDDDADDSIRSDSSVPHELYDRESLSASSLSGSSSLDNESPSPNTSSILDDTPNTSSILEGSTDLEVAEARAAEVTERPNVVVKRDRDGIAEKSSGKLSDAESKPPRRPEPAKVGMPPRPPSSPVNKSRNRRGNKAKRNKNSNTAKKKPTVCVVDKKQTPSYVEYMRNSLDWTVGLLKHLLTVTQAGVGTVLAMFKSTASFWMGLLRLCRMALFTAVRCVGVLISVGMVVCENAYLEAKREWKVTLYFAIVYFTPHCVSLLMKSAVLPHWTPHLLSCVILCCLCQRPYAQKIYYTNIDGNGNKNDDAIQSECARQVTNARNVSKILLRRIRCNLPVAFFLEGFSHEIGTTMALSGPGRLITAYSILILRLGLLFSPMAWLCGAIQVLVASYMNWLPLVDLVILLVGLASLRFSEFLEECNQAAKDIRTKEK